jgi:RNA polymerase sigma factor (sigma-70 family)
MGFAYTKTHNQQMAEDLSQDILLSLATSLRRHESIADLDGFVYTICSYTWSKYFRNNKKHWNNLDVDTLLDLQDECNVEEDVRNKMLLEKLRVEIAYLTKLHREITIMFYYENRTGNEISRILKLPHSTVRWHLGEIKKKLKAGMEMTTNNLNYVPQRIMAGHDGYTCEEYNQCGLGTDRLVDNICLACYGKKLTLEEIARTLMVASGYIENHINRLVYMDYLRIVDKNKYTTNFFIETIRHSILAGKYHYHNIGDYAQRIYDVFDRKYERIKDIGFLGSDLDQDFMLWSIIPLVTNRIYYRSKSEVLRKNNIDTDTPKHKDGSQHWVCATLCDDTYFDTQTEFIKEEIDFYHKSRGNGIKTRNDGLGNQSLQLDSYATIQTGIHWRNFDSPITVNRIAQLIRKEELPNDHDKLMIAELAEQGYVKVVDERPRLLIPCLSKSEYDQLNVILEEIYAELGEEMFVEYIENYAKIFENEIPDFITSAERIYHKYKIYPQYAVLYWLSDHNRLRYPTKEEAKRLCTLVWSNQ